MKFFCVLFPFSLNRINIFARFSLFVVFSAVCLMEQISLNNNTLAFPDGYSRVLFNLFPRKNPGINSPPGPIVSYGYKYNLAHPTATGRGYKVSETAESALRPNIIIPRLLVSPTIPPLGENRPVIFESTKDIKRLVPGVPLLFKLRKPSDEYTFSPWSLSGNPQILLAGSVIPSNYHYKQRSDTSTTEVPTQFPTVEKIEQTERSIISQVNPGDAYLPVAEAKDDKPIESSGESQEISHKDFPSPFPLPRPSLKQIDADDSENSHQSDSESQSIYPDNLGSLVPPNFSNSKEDIDTVTHPTTRPPVSIRNYTAAQNLLKDPEPDTNTYAEIFPVSQKTDATTSLSTIYDADLLEDDSVTVSDISTGNKLTRQVQEPNFDEFLDVPPLHYEPDPTTTEKTSSFSGYDRTTVTEKSSLPHTDTVKDRQNSSDGPLSGQNILQNQRIPQSNRDIQRTTPNSVIATPVIPIEPEQVPYDEESSVTPSGINNTPLQQSQHSAIENNFNRNTQVDRRRFEESELPTQTNSQRGPASSFSGHVPDSGIGSAALDPIQQLISALTASIGKTKSNSPKSGTQQFFTFHIGAININFDNKGSIVPNRYTILSNIASSPSSESSSEPLATSLGTATNSARKPSNTIMTINQKAPNAFSSLTGGNNQYSSSKLADTRITPSEIPFTVPLPKPIRPSYPEEDNYYDRPQETSNSQNQGRGSSVPAFMSQKTKISRDETVNPIYENEKTLPTLLAPQEELDYSDQNVSPLASTTIRVEVTTENIASAQENLDKQPPVDFPTVVIPQEEPQISDPKPSPTQLHVPQSLPITVDGSILPQLIIPIEERVYQPKNSTMTNESHKNTANSKNVTNSTSDETFSDLSLNLMQMKIVL